MSPESCHQEKLVEDSLGSVRDIETMGAAEAEKLSAPQQDSIHFGFQCADRRPLFIHD